MKYFPLIIFALFIDSLQAVLMLAFTVMQFITPVGGGLTGAFAAGYYCWKISSGIISGIANGAACFAAGGVVGAGVSAFAIPIGMAIDVSVSIVFGSGLVLVLAYLGMFSPRLALGTFLGESIPFLDVLPGWTLMTWRCIHNKNKAEKKAQQNTAVISTLPLPQPPLAFDGIRAANDHQAYAQAA